MCNCVLLRGILGISENAMESQFVKKQGNNRTHFASLVYLREFYRQLTIHAIFELKHLTKVCKAAGVRHSIGLQGHNLYTLSEFAKTQSLADSCCQLTAANHSWQSDAGIAIT